MSDLIYDPMTWLAGAGSIIVLVGYLALWR